MRFKSLQNAFLLAGVLTLVPMQAFAAQAQAAKCLSRAQGEALIVNVLPAVIGGVRDKCGSVLGRSAYLMNMDSKVASEFAPAANAAWPTASTALATMIDIELPEGLDISVFRPIIEATLVEKLTNDVKPDSCPAINNIMESLDPLPPANFGQLFVAILEASGEGRNEDSGFSICKTPRN
jgi:hypothetical protein